MSNLFIDMDAITRRRALEDAATDILQGEHYQKTLNEDELAEERKFYADVSIEIQRLEEEKKMEMERLSAIIKAKKGMAAVSLAKIRSGRTEVCEDLYVVQDFARGMIQQYNVAGELVHERPMRSTERQSRISFESPDYSVKVS